MVTQVEPEPHDDDDSVDPTALVMSAAEHIAEQARRHPLRTLGIAFGTGYVLGGGVPRFVVRMAAMSALRTAGAAILTSEATAELARRLLGNLRERARATPPATRPKNGHSNGRKHG